MGPTVHRSVVTRSASLSWLTHHRSVQLARAQESAPPVRVGQAEAPVRPHPHRHADSVQHQRPPAALEPRTRCRRRTSTPRNGHQKVSLRVNDRSSTRCRYMPIGSPSHWRRTSRRRRVATMTSPSTTVGATQRVQRTRRRTGPRPRAPPSPARPGGSPTQDSGTPPRSPRCSSPRTRSARAGRFGRRPSQRTRMRRHSGHDTTESSGARRTASSCADGISR